MCPISHGCFFVGWAKVYNQDGWEAWPYPSPDPLLVIQYVKHSRSFVKLAVEKFLDECVESNMEELLKNKIQARSNQSINSSIEI